MRRQDFELVAATMRRTRPEHSESEWRQWVIDVEELADSFAEQWAAFNRLRFLRNCGYDGGDFESPPGE